MAYIFRRNKDQDPAEQEQPGVAGPTVAPAAAPAAPAASSSPFAAIAPTGHRTPGHEGSGSYYDFNRLIAANKPQGEALAGQMVSGVNQGVADAKQKIGGVVDQFNSKAVVSGANPNTAMPGFMPLTGTKAGSSDFVPSNNGKPSTAPAPTSSYVDMTGQNYGDLVGQYRGAQYAGYNNLGEVEGYGGAQDAVRAAQERARVLANPAARGALLDGGAGYGRGANAFDVLVASAGGQKKFDAAQQGTMDLSRLFGAANTAASTTATGLRGTVDQYHNDADTIERVRGEQINARDTANATAQTRREAESSYQQLSDILKSAARNPEFDFSKWEAMLPEERDRYIREAQRFAQQYNTPGSPIAPAGPETGFNTGGTTTNPWVPASGTTVTGWGF
jgi:cell pole-organizing protein PopZ